MTVGTTFAERPLRGFAPYHHWDRNLFLLYVTLIWIGVVVGFGWDVVHRLQKHQASFPLIVQVHAVVFTGWLVLLTAQVLLIRSRRVNVHRKLGLAGAVLAPIMVVLGLATAMYMGRYKQHPQFLSVQIADMLAFATLVGAGLLSRAHPSAHKRLMLLATLYITDAAFARIMLLQFPVVFGHGFWPSMTVLFGGNDALILGLGGYDLITRGRLHPAYMLGAAWICALQLTAMWLYFDPAWRQIALTLVGR